MKRPDFRRPFSSGFFAGASGFGLLEMLMVLLIVAILMVPAFQLYDIHQIGKKIQETKDNIQAASLQIAFFNSAITLRFPCPADRALGPGDAGYGEEFNATCDPVALGLTLGNCTTDGGICWMPGSRDLNGDSDTDDDGSIAGIDDETVLIGAVPVTTLRDINQSGEFFSDRIALDAWGSKLTYAVTRSLTKASTFKFFNGEIDVEDEFGNNTAGMNENAHYLIVSHGKDQKGAFLENGGLYPLVCGTLASAKDNENCNNDSKFVQGLGMYEAQGGTYYDDISFVVKSEISGLWADITNPAGDETGHIYNLNTRNIGIKTDTPSVQLDVAGALRSESTTRTSQICARDGTDCFNVNDLAGPSVLNVNTCPAGTVVTGYTSGKVDCTPLFMTPPAATDCGSLGKWVHAIKSDGTVVCWP